MIERTTRTCKVRIDADIRTQQDRFSRTRKFQSPVLNLRVVREPRRGMRHRKLGQLEERVLVRIRSPELGPRLLVGNLRQSLTFGPHPVFYIVEVLASAVRTALFGRSSQQVQTQRFPLHDRAFHRDINLTDYTREVERIVRLHGRLHELQFHRGVGFTCRIRNHLDAAVAEEQGVIDHHFLGTVRNDFQPRPAPVQDAVANDQLPRGRPHDTGRSSAVPFRDGAIQQPQGATRHRHAAPDDLRPLARGIDLNGQSLQRHIALGNVQRIPCERILFWLSLDSQPVDTELKVEDGAISESRLNGDILIQVRAFQGKRTVAFHADRVARFAPLQCLRQSLEAGGRR